VLVTYTHSTDWEGFSETTSRDVFADFIKKLEKGKDVTVFFYGDSITYGACSSFNENHAPDQESYPVLFTKALADIYGYKVEFVDARLVAPSGMPTARVPANDYVAGKNGTITYVNTSIGGWSSFDAVNNSGTFVEEMMDEYGCDLFVVAFGMNDLVTDAAKVADNISVLVDIATSVNDEAAIVLVSTMMPNPRAVNGWLGAQPTQEAALISLAEKLRGKDVACDVMEMTSVSKAVLEKKAFHDYSGNNINHPNDFFSRIYAQTLLEVVVGYENIK
jgi:lysophospholipase L1-like esterase